MKHALFGARAVGLGAVMLGLVVGSAGAATTSTPVDTSYCSNPLLSQPFAAAKDQSWYTLVPGQSSDNFDGAGWTLSAGAKIVTTTLADGTTTSVLDLPSGAKAVSPTICITSDYPNARMLVRDVVGSEGVDFAVSYAGTATWDTPKDTGKVHGKSSDWSLSDRVKVQPSGKPGWQPVRFRLEGGGKDSDFQVVDLYVDPRLRA